jgi:hypothetical protein
MESLSLLLQLAVKAAALVEEQAVHGCTVTIVKRHRKSWLDCTLPAVEVVRAHREPQGRKVDLKQQVLLRCRLQRQR